MCRVIGRSKLTKIKVFESLPKSLKILENIDDRKLFILYFGENEKLHSYGFVESSEGLN